MYLFTKYRLGMHNYAWYYNSLNTNRLYGLTLIESGSFIAKIVQVEILDYAIHASLACFRRMS